MRSLGTRETDGMAENTEVPLDRAQVKKAVQALQSFLKSKSKADVLLLDDGQPISLLFTLWKIPRQTQTIRIPLPHGQRSDTDEVCLFTRDEPRMSAEQTQRFYKKLLEERGVRNVSEIIPLNTLKKEYKPYEAKRRLLGNFDMFLSDERIRRLLPSHLGKHFYTTKKMPISINLQSNNLGRDVQRLVQGTRLTVTNRGCCSMARVAHSNMTADEVTENVEAAVRTVAAKLRMKGSVVKLIHLKSLTSVALPIYTSDLSRISVLQRSKDNSKTKKVKKNEAGDETTKEQKKKKQRDEEEEEEIPQLVPIETPSKRPKMEKPTQKPTKPAAAKKVTTGSKVTKASIKATRKAGKTAQTGRRKVPKGK
ncbi:PREDICTED: ribosomal L1 domain-containing protein 1 isoform X1 [Poecilia mexicana]|uniref:Ribosomal L1 domain-containing protein 1 n=1 Tax=Poecilia mexicana TaxID=48701 RepID=A0A3B3YB89_9TELE|nr:PREDICTED: ribosomal L1 domain-containing protein 1 isoform X1 [Poecilia mexicana]